MSVTYVFSPTHRVRCSRDAVTPSSHSHKAETHTEPSSCAADRATPGGGTPNLEEPKRHDLQPRVWRRKFGWSPGGANGRGRGVSGVSGWRCWTPANGGRVDGNAVLRVEDALGLLFLGGKLLTSRRPPQLPTPNPQALQHRSNEGRRRGDTQASLQQILAPAWLRVQPQ